MPVTTKRKKVKLPFFTFQVPVGWEAKPLTPAQKKARKVAKEKARREAAKAAQQQVQAHTTAQQAAKKTPPAPARPPRATVGAAVLPPTGRAAPAKKAPARRSGQLCGQPTKAGGTCRRVVTTVPCPEHPAGRPTGRP